MTFKSRKKCQKKPFERFLVGIKAPKKEAYIRFTKGGI